MVKDVGTQTIRSYNSFWAIGNKVYNVVKHFTKKLYFLIISFIIVPRVSLEENNVSQPGYSFMYDLKNPASTW